MTTIAFRDGVLASDSGVFDRDLHVASCEKIFRTSDGRLGGLSGCYGDLVAFAAWFRAGAYGDVPEFNDTDSEGSIIYPDSRIEWVGHGRKRFFFTDCPYYAFGAGFQIAMGAMATGASAMKAVEVACELNVYTRGPVQTLNLKAG